MWKWGKLALLLTVLQAFACASNPAGLDAGPDATSQTDARADGLAPADGGADASPTDAPPGWSVAVVDDQPKFKSRAALAVGPDGTLHLAYNVATSVDGWTIPSVWYARRQGAIWERTEVAPAGGTSNEFPVLVVDSQNRPHVFYNRAVGGVVDLFMLAGTGSGFAAAVNLTNTTGKDEFAPSVAIDGSNAIHVLFQERTGPSGSYVYSIGYLRVSAGSPGSPEPVASGTAMFSLSPDYDIVADGGGVHVVYCKPGDSAFNNVLYYRHRASSAWEPESRVTATDQDVWSPAIGVDGAGTVHAAYTKGPSWSEKTLTYNRRTSGAWLGEQPLSGSTEDRSYYLGLQVESDGLVHLAFHRFYDSNGDILYLTGRNGSLGPEERVTQTVAGDESSASVARVPGGPVVVSFLENLAAAPDGKVYLATRN
ncbi:MAG: hypothetical protein HY906_19360 [Deltaproteobacteria bacterium]|nr:hypothetical protein [Deltaproteobacteria bacterium]